MEDIPFHELRLYIDGTNDPFDPWKVDEEVENSFYSELKNPITKINNILARAIKEINIISKYSKFEKTILVTFKYAYYPLSKLILGVIRRKKAKAIFTTINKLNKVPNIPIIENPRFRKFGNQVQYQATYDCLLFGNLQLYEICSRFLYIELLPPVLHVRKSPI